MDELFDSDQKHGVWDKDYKGQSYPSSKFFNQKTTQNDQSPGSTSRAQEPNTKIIPDNPLDFKRAKEDNIQGDNFLMQPRELAERKNTII